ncbi:class I tRNA ligase family protein [Kibdelosporangium persicum]|uniref:Methionyl-tRNA synthetase n=1 Tax=Kibdelosporangium persicum TaxID=2698649 RepID=A0ABX2F185_9PSEU|nr:class I tRNA ligase family protein [Kibdelosporangium persicum]NRN65089.1 Methionyl-tRNA synthetase [Kibdelosporangium persicum]
MLVRTLTEDGVSAADIPGFPVVLRRHHLKAGAHQDIGGTGPVILFVLTGSATLSGDRTAGDAVLVPGGGTRPLVATSDLDYVTLSWKGKADKELSRSFDRDQMVWSYEMHLQDLFDATAVPGLPFGSVYGSVPPGVTSKLHCHQDGELFLVLGGTAEVLVEDKTAEVRTGDVIHLPAFHTHGIRNTSAEPFDIVSVYWEDIDLAVRNLAELGQPGRTLLFCPPVTPNGGLHLGHLSGPYLRADLFARALRGTGRDALVITGTDDHQSFVATAAHRLGRTPEAVAAEAGESIKATLGAAGVDLAHFYRPTPDQELVAHVHKLFEALLESPAVSHHVAETPWCEACEQSLYQAFAKGVCPNCRMSCEGEICEACGVPTPARDIHELKCAQCGATPVMRPEPGYELDLDAFQDTLAAYYAQAQGGGQPRRLADSLLGRGLGRFRITRRSRWGLPVGDELVIDPWVELVLTQLINTERFTAGRTSNVTVLGFDNTFFYLVLLPAIYLALGKDGLLPKGFVANRFLMLDGSKFSTSRRHVVWADDVLATVPADIVRVALLRRSPEEDERSLGSDEIADLAADPVVTRLDSWLASVPEVVPGTGAWTTHHRAFYRTLLSFGDQFDQVLTVDSYSSAGYVEKLDALLAEIARFRSFEQARRTISKAQEESRTSVALEFLALKVFAAFVHPVMPDLGAALWHGLGLTGAPLRERNWSFVPGGTRGGLAGRTVLDLLAKGR